MAKNDWKWLKMTSNEKNKITLLSSTLKVTIIKWSPFLDLGTLKGRYCNFLIFHLFYYIALLYKFQDLGGKGKLTPIELKFFVWTSIGVYQYQKKNENDWMSSRKKGGRRITLILRWSTQTMGSHPAEKLNGSFLSMNFTIVLWWSVAFDVFSCQILETKFTFR